jgi:hypothetical protein
MKDGLYKVQFETQLGSGAGVVVLLGGSLRGGDSRTYYAGKYAEQAGQLTAEVETGAHSNPPSMGSVFDVDRVHIVLRGNALGDSAQLVGTAAEAPGVQFRASLTRISN